MRQIKAHIDNLQSQFSKHPFFTAIKNLHTLNATLTFTPYTAFWVMVFQDVLRINESRVSDPFLKKIARHHRIEDRDHHLWYLDDMKILNKDALINLESVFSDTFTSTRDAAYAIMSEVFFANEDILRVALLLTLESSGHIFFGMISDCVDLFPNVQLRYFSRYHLAVEKAHAMFEHELEEKLLAITLKPELCERAIQMIDRVYAAFNAMFDGLLPYCDNQLTQQEANSVNLNLISEGVH